MAVYNTVAGFIQFDVVERKAGDNDVRDVLIQAIGSGGKNVKITLWPENAGIEVEKGDFIVAQGKFSQESVNGKEYLGLSANKVLVFPVAAPKEKASAGVDNALPEEDLLF